jgi:hypothetical protein
MPPLGRAWPQLVEGASSIAIEYRGAMKRIGLAIVLTTACGEPSPGGEGSSSGGSGDASGTSAPASTSTDPTAADTGTSQGQASSGSLDTTATTADTTDTDSSSTGAEQPTCPPTGPGDVGVLDESLLVDSDRIVISESGTVVENVHVHGDIEIVEGASNVTIRNFRITTDGYWGIFVRDGSDIVIEDGEIDGLDAVHDAIRGPSYTARRLYIHDIGGDSFKADGDNTIECNYVTSIGQAPEAHGDGVQMMGGGEIELTANNFDLTSGELTACIFPFGTDPVSGPVYADGNRLNGGAYIVYCHENLHMTNNVFGELYAYGPVTDACGTWRNNTWESTGEPVPN